MDSDSGVITDPCSNETNISINNYLENNEKHPSLKLSHQLLTNNNPSPKSGLSNGHIKHDRVLQSQASSLSIELKDIEKYGDKVQLADKLSGGRDFQDDTFIRIKSARQSKKVDNTTVFIDMESYDKDGYLPKERETESKGANSELSIPPEQFQKTLAELVDEITTKVLINQPKDINCFIADYLEDKLKRERKKDPPLKPKRGPGTLQRRNSKVGKMMFRHATLLAKTSVGFGSVKDNPSLKDMMMNAASLGSTPENQRWYYQIPEDKNIATFQAHKKSVTQCRFYLHYIITSSLDSTICIFDLNKNKKVLTIPNHKPVHCFVVAPSTDGNKILILAGTDDGQVPGWKVKFGSSVTAKLKVMIPMHQPNPIRAMVMSPGLKYLATGCCFVMTQISLWGYVEPSVRGTLKTWDLTSVVNYAMDPKHYYDDINHTGLKTYKQIIARTEKLHQRMASYSKLTDSNSREEETFYGIRALAFTPDDTKIVLGFGHPVDTNIQDIKMMAVVDRSSMETVWLQYASFNQINALQFDPTSGQPGGTWPWAFFVSTECHLYYATLEIKDEAGDKSKVKIKFPWRLDFQANHQGGSFSPDGKLLVSASGKHLLIVESSSGKQLATYSGHKDNITSLTYSSDCKYIGTTSKDLTVRVWKTPEKSLEPPEKLRSRSKEQESKKSKLRLSPRLEADSNEHNKRTDSNTLLKEFENLGGKSKSKSVHNESNGRLKPFALEKPPPRSRSPSPSVRGRRPLPDGHFKFENTGARSTSPKPKPSANNVNRTLANGHIKLQKPGARSRSPSPHPKLSYNPKDING